MAGQIMRCPKEGHQQKILISTLVIVSLISHLVVTHSSELNEVKGPAQTANDNGSKGPRISQLDSSSSLWDKKDNGLQKKNEVKLHSWENEIHPSGGGTRRDINQIKALRVTDSFVAKMFSSDGDQQFVHHRKLRYQPNKSAVDGLNRDHSRAVISISSKELSYLGGGNEKTPRTGPVRPIPAKPEAALRSLLEEKMNKETTSSPKITEQNVWGQPTQADPDDSQRSAIRVGVASGQELAPAKGFWWSQQKQAGSNADQTPQSNHTQTSTYQLDLRANLHPSSPVKEAVLMLERQQNDRQGASKVSSAPATRFRGNQTNEESVGASLGRVGYTTLRGKEDVVHIDEPLGKLRRKSHRKLLEDESQLRYFPPKENHAAPPAELTEFITNHPWYRNLENFDQQLPFDPATHVPYFWHIHKSGGSTFKHVMTCLGRTQTRRMAEPNCNDKEETLHICQLEFGKVINADASSPSGIDRLRKLGLVDKNFPDLVIDTSRVFEALTILNQHHKGRLFVILRDPVERAISKYYYTRIATWERNYKPEIANMTIQEYAKSKYCFGNWIVRRLVHKMDPRYEVTRADLSLAKEVLRQKALILLTSKMEEAGKRLLTYFGWPFDEYQRWCINKFAVDEPVNKNPHPIPFRDSAEWVALRDQNILDVELYDYAVELYNLQGRFLTEFFGEFHNPKVTDPGLHPPPNGLLTP